MIFQITIKAFLFLFFNAPPESWKTFGLRMRKCHTSSRVFIFTLSVLLNCIKLGVHGGPSWQWIMGIEVGRAYMVMAIFTRSINHLQTARSLIPHRMEGEKGAGYLQSKQFLPLSPSISLSFSLSPTAVQLQLLGKSILTKLIKCDPA